MVLSGLKQYPLDLTAVVAVSDSGGSTGRLRSEFGFLPVGDIRQCLAALSQEDRDDYIRQLLLYRFSKGKGLKGHNLGNLLLTALTDLAGAEAKAIEIASRIFRLKGRVFPVSLKKVDLVALYENGEKIIGEHKIDEPIHKGGKKIVKLTSLEYSKVYAKAKEAILKADLIVFCPGDLYTSLLPNLIIKGMRKTLKETKASLIYFVNLMTRYSQTHNFSAKDHVEMIEQYSGRRIDKIFINNKKIPVSILKIYQKEKGYPVEDDLRNDPRVIRKDFLNSQLILKLKGDDLQRSLVRHDSKKVAKAIFELLK